MAVSMGLLRCDGLLGSGRAEPQRRPDLVECDLPDRPDAVSGHRRRQPVTVQVGAELAGLGVGDPGELVRAGRIDGGLRDLWQVCAGAHERDHGLGAAEMVRVGPNTVIVEGAEIGGDCFRGAEELFSPALFYLHEPSRTRRTHRR